METGTPIQSKELPRLAIDYVLEEDYSPDSDLTKQVITKMGGALGFQFEVTRQPSGRTFAIFRLPDGGGVGLGAWRDDFDEAVFLAALQTHFNAHISVVDDHETTDF